jgi:hypothetical protein
MPGTIDKKLQDGILRNQHQIVRFEKSIDAQIQANLLELQRELRLEIEGTDFGSRPATQQRRLTTLQKDVNSLVNDSYRQNTTDLQKGLTGIAKQAERLTVSAINSAFTFDITSVTLTPNELRALSKNPTVLGGKVTENWWKQKTNLKQNFVQQMRLGIAQGETNAQLVDRVIGKPTGTRQTITVKGRKVSESVRTGGIMDAPRRQATALVRTSAQSVSNDTLLATYRENEDIISAVEVLVTLDGRTTFLCISLSGGIWDIQTGEPLPSSPKKIGWPGPPPYHWQCRTVVAPVTKSWDELGNTKKGKILDKASDPVGVRASMSGERVTTERQAYKGFLTDQGSAFQNQVLGPRRAEMFRAGTLKLENLTSSTLDPLTLTQLKAIQ